VPQLPHAMQLQHGDKFNQFKTWFAHSHGERWKHAAFSKAPECSQISGECTSTETSPYVNNSLFISLLLSHFAEKIKLHRNMGMWEHKKLEEIPPGIML